MSFLPRIRENHNAHQPRTATLDDRGHNRQTASSASRSYVASSEAQWSSRNPVDNLKQGTTPTFYQNECISPVRTRPTPSERFEPYGKRGTYRSHPNEYTNAEAGPSTLPASLHPYIIRHTRQPTRGIPHVAANAEKIPTVTEEEEIPVSDVYCSRVPRVTDGHSASVASEAHSHRLQQVPRTGDRIYDRVVSMGEEAKESQDNPTIARGTGR